MIYISLFIILEMDTSMIAVIAGSTGMVGSILLDKLLNDDAITEVISVSRKSVHIENKKLQEILVTDLSELHSHQTELKGDVYFCCLGTTIKDAGSRENFKKVDYEGVIEFAKIAKMNNAQAFVVISAYGASAKSFFFYSRVKSETEAALKQLGLTRLVIFKPSLLIGNRKSFRLGEKISVTIMKALAPILPKALKKRMMTYATDLAEKMLVEGKALQSDSVKIIEAPEI